MKSRGNEFDDLVMSLYAELNSAYKVASRLDVSHKYVYRVLHARGASVPGWTDEKPSRRKLTKEREAEALNDHANGMTFKAMAEKYGCSAWAIRYAVKRNAAERRPWGGQSRRFSDDEIAEMKRLISDGWSQAGIAAKLETSQCVVSRVLRNQGVENRFKASGEKHGSWKGGISKTQNGYLMRLVQPSHPMAPMRTSTGYILEHRLVMAESIGRPLHKTETVHHINGDVTDNRIENLELHHGRHGKGIVLRCRCCGSYDLEEVGMGKTT